MHCTYSKGHHNVNGQKQDESLLEDVWILLRAGRSEEARNLCRSAGQVLSSLVKYYLLSFSSSVIRIR